MDEENGAAEVLTLDVLHTVRSYDRSLDLMLTVTYRSKRVSDLWRDEPLSFDPAMHDISPNPSFEVTKVTVECGPKFRRTPHLRIIGPPRAP